MLLMHGEVHFGVRKTTYAINKRTVIAHKRQCYCNLTKGMAMIQAKNWAKDRATWTAICKPSTSIGRRGSEEVTVIFQSGISYHTIRIVIK
jgi:hypothetical protein